MSTCSKNETYLLQVSRKQEVFQAVSQRAKCIQQSKVQQEFVDGLWWRRSRQTKNCYSFQERNVWGIDERVQQVDPIISPPNVPSISNNTIVFYWFLKYWHIVRFSKKRCKISNAAYITICIFTNFNDLVNFQFLRPQVRFGLVYVLNNNVMMSKVFLWP